MTYLPNTTMTTDPKAKLCPAHYDKAVTPWDLEKCMDSSGDAFVDSRRTDAIEYCFRLKGDLMGDLRKARHCLDEAISHMEGKATTSTAVYHTGLKPLAPS